MPVRFEFIPALGSLVRGMHLLRDVLEVHTFGGRNRHEFNHTSVHQLWHRIVLFKSRDECAVLIHDEPVTMNTVSLTWTLRGIQDWLGSWQESAA